MMKIKDRRTFLLKLIFLCFLSISLSSQNLHSMCDAYREDLESCKKRAFISEYSFEELKRKECGVMTLAFKKLSCGNEHIALVFEIINPRVPTELLLRMIHYGGDGADCCGTVNNPRVDVEGERQVLPKLYRGQKVSLDGEMRAVKASYTKYASWILPTSFLIEAMKMGEEDSEILKIAKLADVGAKHSVSYAAKIMRKAGLSNVDFFWWKTNTPDHLKQLVNEYITPRPDKNWGSK